MIDYRLCEQMGSKSMRGTNAFGLRVMERKQGKQTVCEVAQKEEKTKECWHGIVCACVCMWVLRRWDHSASILPSTESKICTWSVHAFYWSNFHLPHFPDHSSAVTNVTFCRYFLPLHQPHFVSVLSDLSSPFNLPFFFFFFFASPAPLFCNTGPVPGFDTATLHAYCQYTNLFQHLTS